MSLLLFSNVFLCGVFAFAAAHYTMLWWSARRDGLYLTFSLYATAGALVASAIAILAATGSEPVARQAMQLRLVSAVLLLVLQADIVATVCDVRARVFRAVLTVLLLGCGLAMLLVPASTPGLIVIERIRLPWGEWMWNAHLLRGAWWMVPGYAAGLAVGLFNVGCAVRLWRRDRTGAALVATAAVTTFAALVAGIAVDVMRGHGAYASSIPYALWLAVLSAQVARHDQQARRRLAESEARARAVFDQTFQFAALLDLQGHVIEVNETALRFAGIDRAQAVGLPFWDTPWWRHDEGCRAELRTAFDRAVRGEVVRFETWHLDVAGERQEIDTSVKPVLDADGAPTHVIAEGRIVTAQNRAERALRESEARLRAISDNLPGSLVFQVVRELDGSMRFTYVSAAVERLHGLRPADVMADPTLLYRQIHPDDLRRMNEAETRAAHEERVFDMVVRCTPPDGRMRWLRLTSAPRRLPDGRCVWDGLESDITERMVADEALRESEERNRLMVEEVKDHSMFLLDPDGRVTSWNVGAERVHGYTAEEAIGRNYADFFTPADRASGRPRQNLEAALRDGHHVEEGWRVRKDGTRFWMAGSLTPLLAADHTLRGFAKVARDKTEVMRTESLWRSVVDTTLDGILTVDERGVIQSFNRGAESIFGWAAADVVGRDVGVLMPEPARPGHPGHLGRDFRTGENPWIGTGTEVVGLRRDGSTFPMEITVGEYSFDGRRFFTGIVRDVTQRKQLEQQLRQSQKMEAIGQLAGGVAHDFNNLLTVINGYADLMIANAEAAGNAHQDAHQIREAGERAAALTRQLLAFSRQSVMEVRVTSLNAVVTNAEKMLRRLIGENIHLEVQLDPADRRLKADPDQLGQVLLNLAVNARDAMPRGGRLAIETGQVELDEAFGRSRPEFRPGPHVYLAVTDDGSGMTPDVQARIFEPFFTTKGQGEGTGLGLAVVHGIVSQSGGCIEVESAVGSGTTFRIDLPALVESETAASEPEAAAALPGGRERVLVVEDERTVRELAVLLLRRFGYDVLVAANGEAAVQLLLRRETTIDLLLTDVLMPGMSGPELAAHVMALQPRARILYMSGYAPDAILRQGLSEREGALLKKPFSARQLAERVREVLDAPDPETAGAV